jgi:hypothetical protein
VEAELVEVAADHAAIESYVGTDLRGMDRNCDNPHMETIVCVAIRMDVFDSVVLGGFHILDMMLTSK